MPQSDIVQKVWNYCNVLRDNGAELEAHYIKILQELGKKGLLGIIFRKAQNKIQDPAKLKRLISLIDQENWVEIKLILI